MGTAALARGCNRARAGPSCRLVGSCRALALAFLSDISVPFTGSKREVVGVQRARRDGVGGLGALAAPRTLSFLRPLQQRGVGRSVLVRRGLSLTSQHFLLRPGPSPLVYSLGFWPFVSFSPSVLGHDCPAYSLGTTRSQHPGLSPRRGGPRGGRRAWELTRGRCKVADTNFSAD